MVPGGGGVMDHKGTTGTGEGRSCAVCAAGVGARLRVLVRTRGLTTKWKTDR